MQIGYTSSSLRFRPPGAAGSETRPAEPVDRVELSGPIPDYAPVAGVVAHDLAHEIAQPMVDALKHRLGSRAVLSGNGFQGPRAGYDDNWLAWMRDYYPDTVRCQDGSVHRVKFLSPDPKRSQFCDDYYIPVAPPAPGMRFYRDPGQATGGHWLATDQIPLLHEDGNLVSSGRHLFVTDKLLKDNAQPASRELAQAGYRPHSPEETRQAFAQALASRPDQVVVMPPMPGEKTGHVDLYLMALGPDQVMIPQIRPEALEAITYGHEKALGSEVQGFLDERAAQLEKLGYQVSRLPMMPPTFLTASDQGWQGVFDSPANALLINDGQAKTVLLPTFDNQGFPDSYTQLAKRYQQEWCQFFASQGWQPELVDATRLGRSYGLFRCMTHPVPQA